MAKEIFFLHKKYLEEMRNVNNCLTKDRLGNTKLDVKITLLLEGDHTASLVRSNYLVL